MRLLGSSPLTMSFMTWYVEPVWSQAATSAFPATSDGLSFADERRREVDGCGSRAGGEEDDVEFEKYCNVRSEEQEGRNVKLDETT